MTKTLEPKLTNGTALRALSIALLSTLARLGVAALLGAWLLITLLDALATTLVYVIAGVLGLWFTS